MGRFEIVVGDITASDAEAIVNAANESLLGGGGVDGAIHRAAGPELLEECRKLRGCPTGQARLTGGYRLRAKYVIHTVGPVYRDGAHGEAAALASCYRASLETAEARGIREVNFPSISTGVFHYPVAQAAAVAEKAIMEFLRAHPAMRRVRMVCHDEAAARVYRQTYNQLYAGEKEQRL
jgi:O-acetyl-ADP-ribose deacetylase (regulator of RNase III)